MNLKRFAFALVTAILLSQAIHASPLDEAFEIKLSPGNSVYRVTLNVEQRLYDCVIHNIAVINRSSSPLLLQRIDIQFIRTGEVVQSRSILSPELETRAQRISQLFASGALKEAEKEFRIGELFPNAQLSLSSRLEPNKGVLIRHQYLQFSGEVERIRVVAIGKADNGTVSQSMAEIAVLNYQSKTRFFFPLNGTWYVSNATNPSGTHRWGIGQEFAYDLVRVDAEGNSGKGDETRPESYYAYGQEVLAPADGVIHEVRDGIGDTPMAQFADSDPSVMMRRLNEYQTKLRRQYGARGSDGNYVIIDHGNNEYSVMDHLKKNSLRVKRGDRVRQGQVIAQVGQSGLSTEPHLHFEVVSNPDPLRQRGLPVSFYGLEDEEEAKFLNLGDFVRRANMKN
jgi:peptidase M23-like protein